MKSIVLASGNRGKLREFSLAFAGLGIEVLPITSFNPNWEVQETGSTYFINAELKAKAAMQITGLPALADDSGLAVYYLGGAPGVYSQRFAGDNATDEQNNLLLLDRLANAKNKRHAHFTAVLSLAIPNQPTEYAVGRLYGSVTTEPRGEGGFGYDPIFEVSGLGKTLAELSLEEKNTLSHRARALQALLKARDCWHAKTV